MNGNESHPDRDQDVTAEYTKKFGLSREEVEVRIQCPVCGKNGIVRVDKEMVLTDPGRVMRYPVVSGSICEHSFMVTIDVNFKAR